jgi:sporulation protein YpjB
MSVFSYVQAIFSRRLRCLFIGLLAALCLYFLAPLTVWGSVKTDTSSADSASLVLAYNEFLVTAETLYDAVNRGNMEITLKSLRVIEYRFRTLPMNGIISVEGIAALADSITEMRRAVNAISPNEERWKAGAAALRLSADALARPDKPLWHQYRSILSEDVEALKKSLEEASAARIIPASAILSLEKLAQHYSVIRTAVILKTEPSIVERSDSVLRYTERILKAEKPNAEMLKGLVPALHSAMDALFPGDRETTALVPPVAPPPWGWSAMMGSFIVTVLTWVGWRRYRAEPYATSRSRSRLKDEQDAAERLIKRWKK